MIKKRNFIYLLLISFLTLSSCRSSKPIITENKTQSITIKETLHDTVFKIEKDSSSFRALVECQNGKVILKNVTQAEPGRRLKSPKVRLDNNILNVDCQIKEQELFAFWKSKQIREVQVKTITTRQFTNQLTFWQKVQIWLGRIFLLILVFYLIKLLSKFNRHFLD
jgi:hypothetical protein